MKHITFALLGLIFIQSIFADTVYENIDKNGNIIYSNKPSKNAKKVSLPPISIYSSPMKLNNSANKKYTNTSSNVKTIYPKNVNGSMQYKGTNENGRNQILSQELSSEKLALVDSQQALSEAKKVKLSSEKYDNNTYQKRIQGLQDAVTEHQKNIEILSKQLGVN